MTFVNKMRYDGGRGIDNCLILRDVIRGDPLELLITLQWNSAITTYICFPEVKSTFKIHDYNEMMTVAGN